ncbi:MAG: multidrug effflux MFS transporter [Lautropia sp.]|nr:multidrug effflux MFS transporter [Lautropia sp.]
MLKNTGITVALAMLAMVGALGIDAYLPSFPAIIADFQATPLAVQQTLSIYIGMMAITTLFAGTISDSLGRRPTVMLALLLFSGGSILAIFSNNIHMLLLARSLQGTAAGFTAVLPRAIVQDRFSGAEAQRVMALIMMVFSIAPSFAPVIGGWLQATTGWHSVFIMLMLYGLVLYAIWYRGIPETLAPEQRTTPRLGTILTNYGIVLRHQTFILRAFSIALCFSGVALYISSAAPYIIKILGLSETDFGWMFIPLTIGMLAGSSISRRLARKVASGRLIFAGFCLMLLATTGSLLYTSLYQPRVPWAVIPLGVYTMGMTVAIPGMTVEVLSLFPSMRGLAASLQSFIQMGIFALVSAFVAPHIFHSAQAMAITHFAALACAALMWLLSTRNRLAMPGQRTG